MAAPIRTLFLLIVTLTSLVVLIHNLHNVGITLPYISPVIHSLIVGGDNGEEKKKKWNKTTLDAVKPSPPTKPSTNNKSNKKKNNGMIGGNRNVETIVSSPSWPTTPLSPLCEVWAFLEDTKLNHTNISATGLYLEALANAPKSEIDALFHPSEEEEQSCSMPTVNNEDICTFTTETSQWRFENSTSYALSFAESILTEGSLDFNMLSYALSLRAYCPTCEMHRGMARDAALASGLYHPDSEKNGDVIPEGFVVLFPNLVVVSNVNDLKDAVHDVEVEDKEEKENGFLPDEVTLGGKEGRVTAVLYGHVGSTTFSEFYKGLKDSGIWFVVRHMGDIGYEERSADTDTASKRNTFSGSKTYLQGYGVRLDIRNVEYKAFEGGTATSDEDDDEEDEAIDATFSALGGNFSEQILAGINIDTLLATAEHDDSATSALRAKLRIAHKQQQKRQEQIPPAWERRALPLQAATVISGSDDPLWALLDISQNLPSRASSLVNVVHSKAIRSAAEEIWNNIPLLRDDSGGMAIGGRSPPFHVFCNGKYIYVERPSFNLFEFLNTLREEDAVLASLEDGLDLGKDGAPYRVVHSLLARGESWLEASTDDVGDDTGDQPPLRIDVGRGGKEAIIYANDIEKDQQYASWPRSMQGIMMAQYGRPAVRRNIYTFLIAFDPTMESSSPCLDLAFELMQHSFPVRVGLLLINNKDVDTLQRPSEDEEDENVLSMAPDELNLSQTATIMHVYEMFDFIKDNFDGFVGLSLLNHLGKIIGGKHGDDDGGGSNNEKPTLELILRESANVFDTFGIELNNDHLITIKSRWKSFTASSSYKKGIYFAQDKGIKSGMSFLNGRPMPYSTTEEIDTSSFRQQGGQIFAEEQQHMAQLVMAGKLTERAPRSVYAMVLSGKNFFPKYHPLLQNRKTYAFETHDKSKPLFILPASDKSETSAFVTIEAVLDLESREGLSSAETFLSLVTSPDLSFSDGDSAVRIAFHLRPLSLKTCPRDRCLMSRLFHNLNEFDPKALLSLCQAVLSTISNEEGYDSAVSIDLRLLIATIAGLSEVGDYKKELLRALEGSASVHPPTSSLSQDSILVNGQVMALKGSTLSMEDLKLLVSMEVPRSRTLTKTLAPFYSGTEENQLFWAVARVAAFLGVQHTSKGKTLTAPMDVDAQLDNLSPSSMPLQFQWNNDDGGGSEHRRHLQVKVTVILDPLSNPTQRVAPILMAIRDHLKLPLRLVLAPRMKVAGEDELPLTSYYRFVADPLRTSTGTPPAAFFRNLPTKHVLTMKLDTTEAWNVQQLAAIQDTDNLRCEDVGACGDSAFESALEGNAEGDAISVPSVVDWDLSDLTVVEYALKGLMFFGQCYDMEEGAPPNGLQLTLTKSTNTNLKLFKSLSDAPSSHSELGIKHYSDTLVMQNLGYWQLRARPGVWEVSIAKGSRGSEIFSISDVHATHSFKLLVMKGFVNRGELLKVERRPGFEETELLISGDDDNQVIESSKKREDDDDVIHVFSLATGHLYERLLKIMMLSVTKRTSMKVKFWLFENFLSPSFKASASAMAEAIGCELEFVTYKWPEWLRSQSEKQRIIWGYKILFLDVLFPLNVKKIIYVDADQVVRGDLKELWDLDLEGAPYGYTPFCGSREETLGFQFWRSGFWESHLRGRPYHISALYVVDLERFRQEAVGDKLRGTYQQLSADPNSLANLDQDLPNYAQHMVKIHSLPQEWLWCETWCSDETKAQAKTIDLCNNPQHKENKVSMAKRIISGELFEESWIELDEEVKEFDIRH